MPRFTYRVCTNTLAIVGSDNQNITLLKLRPNALCAAGPPRYITLGVLRHAMSLGALRSVRSPLLWSAIPSGTPAIPVHLPAWGRAVGFYPAHCLVVHGLPAALADHLCAVWRAHGLVAGLWAAPGPGGARVAWAVHGALARAVRAMITSGNGGTPPGGRRGRVFIAVGRAPAGSIVKGTPPLPAAAYAPLAV